jgi:uncharacterized protein (DUF2249 family)
VFDNGWEYSEFIRTNLRPRRLLDALAKLNKKGAQTKIPLHLSQAQLVLEHDPSPLHSEKEIKEMVLEHDPSPLHSEKEIKEKGKRNKKEGVKHGH